MITIIMIILQNVILYSYQITELFWRESIPSDDSLLLISIVPESTFLSQFQKYS